MQVNNQQGRAEGPEFNHCAAASKGIVKTDGQGGHGSQINTSAQRGSINTTPLFHVKSKNNAGKPSLSKDEKHRDRNRKRKKGDKWRVV